ncbi:unnamed protein product, partial [Aureobasidium mustum]
FFLIIMISTTTTSEPLEIAIIGGGIVGLILAAGLIHRDVKVKVYEQARGFREIGAGIAFTANAIRCMELINPYVVTALRSGGSVPTSADKDDPNDYLRWIDGFNERDANSPKDQKLLYKIDAGYKGFEGCRRDQFLESLVDIIPDGTIELRKRLERIDWGEKMSMAFSDGTRAEADAIIACDGIKSKARELVFGKDNPVSYPAYTHKVAYRALIPMDKAVEALGEYKARNQHNHVGPGAHLIHYPVANGAVINATAFISDPDDWPSDRLLVAPGSRDDLVHAFRNWNPCVRDTIAMFPEKLEKWAVFDLCEYPVPYYNKGKICLAGDAAHASSPHHGAGACMGVEDALCLSTLVDMINTSLAEGRTDKDHALKAAFETYNCVRRARSQWLVNSSRRVCDLYHQEEWAHSKRWTKAETCFEEIKDRSQKIWHFDFAAMVADTIVDFERRLELAV